MDKSDQKDLDKRKMYRAFFKHRFGEKILLDLMKTHWVLASTFVRGDRDEMVLREGERNVVLRILSILQVDPKKLQALLEKEEINRDEY